MHKIKIIAGILLLAWSIEGLREVITIDLGVCIQGPFDILDSRFTFGGPCTFAAYIPEAIGLGIGIWLIAIGIKSYKAKTILTYKPILTALLSVGAILVVLSFMTEYIAYLELSQIAEKNGIDKPVFDNSSLFQPKVQFFIGGCMILVLGIIGLVYRLRNPPAASRIAIKRNGDSSN